MRVVYARIFRKSLGHSRHSSQYLAVWLLVHENEVPAFPLRQIHALHIIHTVNHYQIIRYDTRGKPILVRLRLLIIRREMGALPPDNMIVKEVCMDDDVDIMYDDDGV